MNPLTKGRNSEQIGNHHDLRAETKAAAEAELSGLLKKLGIEEPLKRVYPPEDVA